MTSARPLRRLGPPTLSDYVSLAVCSLACTPGASTRLLRRDYRDRGEEPVWLVRVECPFKAGAPFLLARVTASSHLATVRNVPMRSTFECPLDELVDAARRSAETRACQRWQRRRTLRLRRLCRDLRIRLHACRRDASPLAGTDYLERSAT